MATQALDSFASPGKQAPARRAPMLAAVPVEAAPREPRLSPKIWAAILVIGLHTAALAALLSYHHIVNRAKPPEALVLLDIAAPAPPAREAPPEIPDIPPAVIPPPVIEIENRPPSIAAVVMETPPPPVPAPVSASVKSDGPPAPPAAPAPFVADLGATMIEAVPPRYPLESRRLKEQGTVVLELLLGVDGRVEQISVRSSSGFSRLDQAALHAVRKWRWSPTLRNGNAVPVRGLVEIPFVLAPHS